MSELTEINEIVKRRYETGAYGNAHFKMPRSLWDDLRASMPPAEPEPDWRRAIGNPLGDFLSIPIVVDDTLPSGTWRLVDSSTGEVLHEGRSDVQ
jgi:hypothetical protein